MPILIESKEHDYNALKTYVDKGFKCGCGAPVSLAWGGAFKINAHILRCSADINHTRLARPAVLSAMDTPDGLNIGNMSRIRREKLVTELGERKATALAKYAGAGALTQVQAQEIVVTIWPGAPEVEVRKAAMVCCQYGLNPLMKHLYLIPFNSKQKDGTWAVNYSMVLGIKASRIIARRKGNYAYLDDTPRFMTPEEQIKIFGVEDTENICAITRLKDTVGNTAIGTGKWPKSKEVKGEDKGNSKLNMAMIRSERQALERLFPDSLPTEAPDVVDERYQDLEDGRKVEVSTGEIKERAAETPSGSVEEGQFTESATDWDKLDRNAPVEAPAKTKRDISLIKTIGDMYTAIFADLPGRFKTKLDVLKFMGKTETDIADPAAEYSAIMEKVSKETKVAA